MKADNLKFEISTKISWFILTFIVAAQIAVITYAFAVLKTSFHYDETYSFALSNSYYAPFITGKNADSKLDLSNYNVMVNGEYFEEYYTVGEDDAFSYGSVYHNQIMDVHPPLYYIILHTICSFFPGVMSKWMGYPINILSFVICQLYLFKLTRAMTHSDFWGLWTCAFWGFTISCIDCFVYIRMYAMLTAIAVAFAYYTYCVFDSDSPRIKKHYFPLGMLTLLGSLTHHYFLIYGLFFTVFCCVVLIIRKKIKKMFQYGLSVLIGALISLAVFPATFSHLLNSNTSLYGQSNSLKFDFIPSIKVMLMYTLNQICGIMIPVTSNGYYSYFVAFIVLLTAVSVPLCYLFRKSSWFIKAKSSVKNFLHRIKINDYLLSISAMCIVMIVFTSNFINIVVIDEDAPRYIFFIVPLLFAIVASILCSVVKLLRKIKWCGLLVKFAAVTIASASIFSCYRNSHCHYIFKSVALDKSIQSFVNGSDLILAVSSTYRTQEIGWLLIESDDIYITNYMDMYISEESAKQLLESENLYLAIQVEYEEAQRDYSELVGIEIEEDDVSQSNFVGFEYNTKRVIPDVIEYLKEKFPEREIKLVTIAFETNDYIELYSIK